MSSMVASVFGRGRREVRGWGVVFLFFLSLGYFGDYGGFIFEEGVDFLDG